MIICEICGAKIDQQEDEQDLEMAVLGVCEDCRQHYVQSQD